MRLKAMDKYCSHKLDRDSVFDSTIAGSSLHLEPTFYR
ncbi:unnamed protein product [Arabidopsis halleri]